MSWLTGPCSNRNPDQVGPHSGSGNVSRAQVSHIEYCRYAVTVANKSRAAVAAKGCLTEFEVHASQAYGVGHDLDVRDHAAFDGEVESDARGAPWRPNRTRAAIDQRGPGGLSAAI